MADNIEITPGTGATVATDEVGAAHFQLIKLVAGQEDTAARIGGDAANGLDVDVTRSALPDGAATEVTLADISDAQGSTTDAAVSTDADGTISSKLRGLIVLLLALTAKLPGSIGQKAKATSLAVTIASDQDALPVTGTFFQATQPVSGTVAVSNFPATQPVSGPLTDAQIRATALPVSAATLPLPTGAATSAQIGEVQASPTANTVLDRLKALLTGIVLAAGSAVIGKVGIDQTTPGTTNAVDTELPAAAALGDSVANPTTPTIGSALLGYNGAALERVRVANIQKDLSAVTITSITTVWTPASGKKFRLMGGTISVSAAGSVLFEDNTAGTTIFRTPKLLADTPFTFVCNGGQGKLSAAADNILKATLSVAGAITGTLWGTEE